MGLGLTGCTALVTGASTGLGRTVAERLARVGTDVAVAGSAGAMVEWAPGRWRKAPWVPPAAGGTPWACWCSPVSAGSCRSLGAPVGRALGRYYNSMFKATTVSSRWGTREMLPIEAVLDVLRRHGMVP